MTGVSVDDPDYLLLALSCLAVVIGLLAAKYRESFFLVRIVLCGELGLVILFLWNSTVPSSFVISDPYYFAVAVVGSAGVVFFIWHSAGGIAVAVVLAATSLLLFLAGRDTISGWFGGLSNTWLAVIFVVFVLVVLAIAWWLKSIEWIWTLTSVLFMGFGMALAVNVIYQEADSGNQNLDLVDFSYDPFLYIIGISEAVTLLLYYRHVICPINPPSRSSPPPPQLAQKAPPLRSYYAGLSLVEEEEL
jgi:hypothetical protein